MIAAKQGMERIGRRLKLRDLRILMTVVECGTMGKAAGRLASSRKSVEDVQHAQQLGRVFDLRPLLRGGLVERRKVHWSAEKFHERCTHLV